MTKAPNPITHPEMYCTSKEACEILQLTRSGLLQARNRGRIDFYKLGRSIFWLRSSVEHYNGNRYSFPIYRPGEKKRS